MKIRVKWLLTGALALVAAALAAGYAILAAFDSEDLRGVIEAEAKAATGRTLTIGGPMELEISWSPTIAIEKLSLGNAPWGVWPEVLSIRRLEVKVALLPLLSGEVQVRRLVAHEPVILLETNAAGEGNWVLDDGAAKDEASRSESGEADLGGIPAFHRIEVRNGRAIFRSGESGAEFLLKLRRLDGEAETPDSPARIALEGDYNGVPISAAGTLGSRSELLSGTRFPLELELGLASASLKLAGEIAALAAGRGLALEIDMRGKSLAELGPLLGQDLPPLGPYTLAGRLSDTEQGFEIADLALRLGNSDLAGTAALDLAGARPAIAAALEARALELRDFLGRESETPAPETAPEPAEAEPAKPGRVFSDEPLPLDALQAFDAQIKLKAEQALLAEKTMVADLTLEAALEAGRLSLRELGGTFSGGVFEGALTLDTAAAEPPLSLEFAAEGFDYGRFLLGRDVTDGVEGTLDAEAKLSAAGRSLHAWARSLNGRVSLVGGAGRVRSDLLQAGGAGLLDMVSAWREGDKDMTLNCVVMRLPLEQGVMKTEAVLLDTAAVTVGVTGEVDLGREALDLKVTPQAKQTSLMSLAVPLRVTGALADPGVTPDALGTALGAAKIAGMFINPLAAGALIIMKSELADENPCVATIEGKAGGGGAPAPATPAEAHEAPGSPSAPETESPAGEKSVLEELEDGVSKGLKGLFGE